MEINTHQLEALLELLVTNGVEEFEGYGFHVRFTENMFTRDRETETPNEIEIRDTKPEPASIWQEENLWPGGKPPSFPGK